MCGAQAANGGGVQVRFTSRKSLLAEVAARRLGTATPRKPIFLDPAFPAQSGFIADPAKLKVVLWWPREATL